MFMIFNYRCTSKKEGKTHGRPLTSTGMVVVPAEYVGEKIVEAARNEPDDLYLDEGLLKETVS
jgi:hypothetical protein